MVRWHGLVMGVFVSGCVATGVAGCGGGELLANGGNDAGTAPRDDDDDDNDPVPGDDGGTTPLDGSAPDATTPVDGGGNNDAGAVNPPITTGKKCNLNLHWAGGSGKPDSLNLEGVTEVWPTSPGGAFWLYDGPHNFANDPDTGDADYQSLVTFLEGVLTASGCGPTVIIGYSNGGGFAAKLYCEGEDFGGRAWAYMIDDPVMDDGVRGCAPSPNIRKVMFTHSDELTAQAATANHSCTVTTWYCEDNRTMPLSEYETVVGQTSIRQREFHGGGDGTWKDDFYAAWAVPARWWENDF